MSLFNNLKSTHQENNFSHLGLLILRIVLGSFMMRHGFGKMEHFSEIAPDFYSFLGLGGKISLGLVIFSEFFCSIFLILGLFTRIAVIPLIITMIVIIFIIHADDPIGKKELAYLYFGGYITLLLKGSGKFSVDYLMNR